MNWERKGNFKNQIAKLNLHQGDWVTQLLSDYFQLYNKYVSQCNTDGNFILINDAILNECEHHFY